ncbi:MAG: hypothetical protein K2J42_02055 [Muribaculaceae bacterium]|nr:hypothetical protein [Muribaculaceae bacterium]
MKKHVLFLGLLTMFAVTACDSNEGNENLEKERADIVLSRSEEAIANAESDYAFDLVSKLYEIDKKSDGDGMKNIFVSPLSMFIDFSMLANGGSGDYQEKIMELLKLDRGTSIDELNDFNRRIVNELLAADPKVKFSIANSLWTHTTVDLKKPFVETLLKYYEATASSVDFDSNSTVDKINGWAKSATKGLIPKVFEYGNLTSKNVFALCNALYFEGKWASEIKESNTTDRVFYNQNGLEPMVPTMQTKADGGIFKDNLTVLKKDYGNCAYSIYFILPDEGVSLQSVMSELNDGKWRELKENINEYFGGIIRFPKLKIDYNIRLTCEGKYESLGTNEVLSDPDLREMTDKSIPGLQVIQNNTVEVDESGSKAAAVTVITGNPTSAMPSDPQIPIDINRPFMFLIEECSTGTILFAGAIVNM